MKFIKKYCEFLKLNNGCHFWQSKKRDMNALSVSIRTLDPYYPIIFQIKP